MVSAAIASSGPAILVEIAAPVENEPSLPKVTAALYWFTPAVPLTWPSANSAVMVALSGIGSGSAQLLSAQLVPCSDGCSAGLLQRAPRVSRVISTTVSPTRLVRFATSG